LVAARPDSEISAEHLAVLRLATPNRKPGNRTGIVIPGTRRKMLIKDIVAVLSKEIESSLRARKQLVASKKCIHWRISKTEPSTDKGNCMGQAFRVFDYLSERYQNIKRGNLTYVLWDAAHFIYALGHIPLYPNVVIEVKSLLSVIWIWGNKEKFIGGERPTVVDVAKAISDPDLINIDYWILYSEHIIPYMDNADTHCRLSTFSFSYLV